MKQHMMKPMVLGMIFLAGMLSGPVAVQAEMSHGEHGAMSHSGHMGVLIHESTVEGYHLAYHLIDMAEQMKGMKMDMDMTNSKMGSHHLMVYLQSPEGTDVGDATVGYLITNPNGENQKTMAMGMTGGFGADVNLKAKGTYVITVKALIGSTKVIDKFEYVVQ